MKSWLIATQSRMNNALLYKEIFLHWAGLIWQSPENYVLPMASKNMQRIAFFPSSCNALAFDMVLLLYIPDYFISCQGPHILLPCLHRSFQYIFLQLGHARLVSCFGAGGFKCDNDLITTYNSAVIRMSDMEPLDVFFQLWFTFLCVEKWKKTVTTWRTKFANWSSCFCPLFVFLC